MAGTASTKARWIPPTALFEVIDEFKDRVSDFSVPMEKISALMMKDTREVYSVGGPGDWPPHAKKTIKRWGRHPLLNLKGKLISFVGRDWSPTNAVVISAASHAHFSELGTERHETARYQQKVNGKTQRKSRSEIRKHQMESGHGTLHEPIREAVYVDEFTAEKFPDIILDYIIGETSK